ncbi:MAG: GNAT family N-acetyltransferase [Wolbachia endosymbiont of Meromenopon meropis]|nr:GNAT family N-acetyltransferase [Wolbachia endosymbiont of Meromenopon meropis]
MQNKKKICYSKLIIRNLKDYMLYAANLSQWEVHSEFANITFIINGTKESLFNFVFCGEQCDELSIEKTLNYLRARNIEATWVMDSHVKTNGILKKCNVKHISTPKKALLNMQNYLLPSDIIPNLRLNIVNNHNLLEQLDLCTSKIFHHNVGIVSTFFRGLSSIDNNKNSKLRFFLATLNSEIVGTCCYCIHGNIAGFYSDGVLPLYRNRGIGTQMVLERIKIIQQFRCEYVVAHCMKPSVNLYRRLGFQILGNLYLYTSSA